MSNRQYDNAVAEHPCPFCGAAKGSPCVTRTGGNPIAVPHAHRLEAYWRAGRAARRAPRFIGEP